MANLNSLTVNDTGGLTLPSGTKATRPSLSSTIIVQWSNTGTQSVSTLSGSATTTSTSWTCPTGVSSIEVLVVAGGGAGGGYHGGGGGAGGVIYNSAYPVTAGTTYTVTVGQGGSAATASSGTGNPGSNSVFGALTAIGGGAGLSQGTSTPASRNNGGSGGGASDSSGVVIAGYGTAGQGHSGGGYYSSGNDNLISYSTSGGGGAGGPGFGSDSLFGGCGGPGLCFDISGTPTWYGGGGGGTQLATGNYSAPVATYGLGGIGGGGAGGYTNTSGGAAVRTSVSGTNGTGGGGGGYLYSGLGGGAGGSGTVIIRYALSTSTSQPIGQTRFNTVTNSFENFETSNRWTIASTKENIVTNGLVVYLDAARYGSGSTWLNIAGTADGTLTSTTYSSNGGGSLVFNGTNSYVSVTNPTITGQISYGCWFKADNTTWRSMIAGPGVTQSNGIQLSVTNGTSLAGYMYIGTWHNVVNGTCPLGQWNYCMVTYDGREVKTYVNGVFQSSQSEGTNWDGLSAITIGNQLSSQHYSGSISNVQIYNRALTQEEIKQNYNAQCFRFELASPADSRLSYVIDGLAVDLDMNNPACLAPPQAEGITGTKLMDLVSGTRGSLVNGAIPVATQNYKFVKLDGTNDYISMSQPNITLGNTYSYDFWIYVTGIKDATYARAYIIDLRGDGVDSGTNNYFLWDYVSAGTVNFITGNSGVEVQSGSVPLSVNAWHHFATTRSGAEWKIYLDGMLVGQSTSNTSTFTLNNAYRIGMYSGWGFSTSQYALPGYVGAARIYTKTLTSSEVLTNYRAMKNRYGI